MKKLAAFFLVVTVLLAATVLAGCTKTAPVDNTPVDDPAVYWNTEKGAERTASADGTYTIKVVKDGAAIDLKVADQATMEAIDKLEVFGVTLTGGKVTAVKTVEDMGYTKTGWGYYVDMIGGKMVNLNAAEDSSGKELTINTSKDTLIYDMSDVAEVFGQATKLQEADQIMVLQKGEDVTHIFVCDRDGVFKYVTKKCEACGKDVEWTNWFYTDAMPAENGHYYLENDVTLAAEAKLSSVAICLDLNGKTVKQTAAGRRIHVITGSTEYNLMDSVGTGKLIPSAGEKSATEVKGQAFELNGTAVLNMYSGTIDASQVYCTYGSAINVWTGTFNMYGGKIIGGKGWGSGGATIMCNSRMTMSGGEITGGISEGDGRVLCGGGNIRVTGAGQMMMTGGKITGGTAKDNGGNIHVTGSFTMTGGEISGGTATKGNDLYSYNGGKINVSGTAKVGDTNYS